MNAALHGGIFAVDVAVAAAAGWLWARMLHPAGRGFLEGALAWLLAMLVLVAASGVALGAVGGLGPVGFLGLHGAVAVLLAWVRRGQWREDGAALVALGTAGGAHCRREEPLRWLIVLACVVLAGLVVLAALGRPAVYDALTYRLPRIGQWLQDGRIAHLDTDDARLNFMAIGPDLVVAWLIGARPAGYQLAALAQTVGGVLLLGATIGLGRLTGLSRAAAFGAAMLVLGMANVAPQMTSLHTDLFAAGVLAAAVYLWLVALRRGEGTWLGGAGIGFALGAKGSVFYLLPGVVGWMLWFAWRHPASARAWARTGAGLGLAALVFAGPVFWRNKQAYGGWAGRPEDIVQHYGPAFTVRQHLAKLTVNLRSSAAQLLEPNSQPLWWREWAAAAGRRVIAALPEQDPYAFEDVNRRATLAGLYRERYPDADCATPGVTVAVLCVLGGLVAAVWWRRACAQPVLMWCAGVVIYVVVQHAVLQWHPWTFRYAVLAAPWLAIVAGWGIEQMPRMVRLGLWVVALAGAAAVFVDTTLHAPQAGWPAARPIETAPSRAGPRDWRSWAATLDQRDAPLRIALPVNRPLARFYRLDEPRPVQLCRLSALGAPTAEAAVAGHAGWLVVPARFLMGREGRVVASTWIFNGDDGSVFSVAAYRAQRPGESSPPVLYRRRVTGGERTVVWELALRSWQNRVVLEVVNPTAAPWEYEAVSSAGSGRGTVTPGGTTEIAVPVRADGMTETKVTLRRPVEIDERSPGPELVRVR